MGYLISIDGIDYTPYARLDGYQVESALNDHMPSLDIMLAGHGLSPQSINETAEVLIVDDGNNPTQNLLQNPLLNMGIGGLGSYTQIPDSGATFSGTPLNIALSNATHGFIPPILYDPTFNFVGITQTVAIAPGQTYTFSAYIHATSLVGAKAILRIGMLDPTQAKVYGQYSDVQVATTSGTQRFSVTATAQDTHYFAVVMIGVVLTSSTNSGNATFSALQMEAQTFAAEGVSYPTPDCNSNQLDSFVLPDGTTIRQIRYFAGVVVLKDPDYTDHPGLTRLKITCRGPLYLLEAKFVNGIYSGYDSDILNAIVSQLTPGMISTAGVVQGVLISDSRSYDDLSMLEVAQDLCNTSGFSIFMDFYYTLYYTPLGYLSPSYGLSDDPDGINTFGYEQYTNPVDATQMGNRVTVHGGAFTATTTDTFTISGTTTSSLTLTQIKPTAVLNIFVNGTQKRVGINGNNNTTFAGGYDALVDFPKHKVNFSGNLPNSATVAIEYIYDGQIREQAWDLQSIAKYARRGFDGIFDKKVNDTSITTSSGALQRANAELAQIAYGLDKPTFIIDNTMVPAPLIPGQTVQISNDGEGWVAKPYLVQKITATLRGGGIVAWLVECGADIPTFERQFKHHHKSTHRSKHLAGSAYTSVNLIARETVSFQPESIAVETDASTTYVYGTATYGYSSYYISHTVTIVAAHYNADVYNDMSKTYS